MLMQIDGTFLFVVISFLIFLFIIKKILFQPITTVIEQRDKFYAKNLKTETETKEKSKLLTEECWHGDTWGVFPDYWCEPKDIITVLSYLTKNKNLKNFIKL